MKPRAYYNEIDPFAAEWLRELIRAGHIAPGDVDERSIEDVEPIDLAGYTQCHFFAGIGVWSYALRKAGWEDSRPVWTGSCPCQPFSAAGKGKGFTDERHLWPAWFWLIDKSRPDVIFGEQVASKDGLSWFDLVSTDLEASGYTCGAVNLPACGVGAPHIRQRMWFVADRVADSVPAGRAERRAEPRDGQASGRSSVGGLGNTSGAGTRGNTRAALGEEARVETEGRSDGDRSSDRSFSSSPTRGVAHGDTHGEGSQGRVSGGNCPDQRAFGQAGLVNGQWANAEWVYCRDGKYRPVEPGSFPLAHGASARVGRLRGYGNAVNAEAAKAVIEAYMIGEIL